MRVLITSSEDRQRQLIDGVRIFEDDGWVLIAPDRTSAAFNIQAESTSVERTEELISRYQVKIDLINPSKIYFEGKEMQIVILKKDANSII